MEYRLFEAFNSYSEISPSGRGLHIIIKAEVLSGRRRDKVELYSSERFFCMTGNVHLAAPITERQELASILWDELGKGRTEAPAYAGDPNEKYTDDEIVQWALNAANGEKFAKLLKGDWQGCGYPSQSEADFAFINIIAYYTQARNQIVRIFRNSPLGQRKKAHRADYVEYMLKRAFDNQVPLVNIEGLSNPFAELLRGRAK